MSRAKCNKKHCKAANFANSIV